MCVCVGGGGAVNECVYRDASSGLTMREKKKKKEKNDCVYEDASSRLTMRDGFLLSSSSYRQSFFSFLFDSFLLSSSSYAQSFFFFFSLPDSLGQQLSSF